MTFGFLSLVIAFGLGVVFTAAGFVYLNRKSPNAVDAAEGKVRDFKRPW